MNLVNMEAFYSNKHAEYFAIRLPISNYRADQIMLNLKTVLIISLWSRWRNLAMFQYQL